MFAHDLLLLGEATPTQAKCVVNVLENFCKLSGQEVSKDKTHIFLSKKVNIHMRRKLAQMSGF